MASARFLPGIACGPTERTEDDHVDVASDGGSRVCCPGFFEATPQPFSGPMTMLDDQAAPATPPTPPCDRLLSIDALQGFDMLWIVGVNAIPIYVVPRFIDFDRIAQFFLGGLSMIADHWIAGDFAPVASAIGAIIFKYVFLFYFYKRCIFLRVWHAHNAATRTAEMTVRCHRFSES